MVNDDSLVSLIVIEAVNRRRIHAERMAGRARRAGSRTAGGQWSERRHAKPSIESTAKSAREFVHRHTHHTQHHRINKEENGRKRPDKGARRPRPATYRRLWTMSIGGNPVVRRRSLNQSDQSDAGRIRARWGTHTHTMHSELGRETNRFQTDKILWDLRSWFGRRV